MTWRPFTLSPEDEAEIAALAAVTPEKAIGLGGARQLRRLCRVVQPRRIIEVGTYTGMSTRALVASGGLFTCDTAGPRTTFENPWIATFWNTPSHTMLTILQGDNAAIDLVFYDASVRKPDATLLRDLIHDKTVFAFHDYRHFAKGVRGVKALHPLVPTHALVVPADDDPSASVAVLAPRAIAEQLGC